MCERIPLHIDPRSAADRSPDVNLAGDVDHRAPMEVSSPLEICQHRSADLRVLAEGDEGDPSRSEADLRQRHGTVPLADGRSVKLDNRSVAKKDLSRNNNMQAPSFIQSFGTVR